MARRWSCWLLALGLLGLGWFWLGLRRSSPASPAVPPLVGIQSNLQQIALAKAHWLEGHSAGETRPLEPADLTPYLLPGFWKRTVAGERYRINRQGASPEAELTRAITGAAKGTRLRLGADGQIEPVPADTPGP